MSNCVKSRVNLSNILTKRSFFTLAQISAILSGTWMVAASIASNSALWVYSNKMEEFSLYLDARYMNDSLVMDNIYNLFISSDSILIYLKVFLNLYTAGIIFGIFAIIFVIIGSILND